MTKHLFLLLFLLGIPLSLRADEPAPSSNKPSLAGQLIVEAGRAFPGAVLKDWVSPGTSYRLKLFGGAHLPKIPWLGAVGLGFDFAYSSHSLRSSDPAAYYRRYLWDWLFIPVSFGGLVTITPGLSWVVTDVQDTAIGVQETSIRPGAAVTVGVRLPLVSHFGIRVDGRAETALADHERRANGSQLNLTGPVYSGFAGLEVEF